MSHASGNGGLALLATPSAGTSELLRQAYDRLFFEQENVVPFYFEVASNDGNAQNAARRFLYQFLLQTVAFKRRDASIIDVSPSIDEIAELAAPSYGHWIDRLVEAFHRELTANDEKPFVRNCLGAPLRAATHDVRSFLMIDAVHLTDSSFLDELIDVFSRASIPFVFAGHRRFLFGGTKLKTMNVGPLNFNDAGELAARLSAQTGVAINDQTRDLIALQLGGKPGFFNCLFGSAVENGVNLDSFERVEQTYTDDIFGGQTARYLDAVFERVVPNTEVCRRLLSELVAARKISVGYLRNQLRITNYELRMILDGLHWTEIANVTSGTVEFDASNIVLSDYIKGRLALETEGRPRALVVGEALTRNINRAPESMARFYRKSAAIGLRELLRKFDGRNVSAALLDYGKFKAEFKGAGDDKIIKSLKEDNAKISLPRIVYTAHTGDFYAKLNELCDIERSAVALGFVDAEKRQDSVWIAAEIDSKLEANCELVELWCSRLEKAAADCGFADFNIWLVAREGFDAAALNELRSRKAFGSSHKQVELLAGILGAEIGVPAQEAADEYEFVIPMGENTEMIAAHTVEEIAKRHSFSTKAINQIKTALVEACINAAEHSLSPDRKIYQRFVVDNDKLTITVSNRGLRLADKITKAITPDEGRRGWGLKLIKGLMDEVNIDQVDDGTRITMIKFLKLA